MFLKIKKLRPKAIIPTKAHERDAGYDLFACINEAAIIPPHKTVKISTGIAAEVEGDNFVAVFARSGMATKEGLRPANCVGVIDPNYRGEYIVPIHNDTDDVRIIYPNDRIAQFVIIPFVPATVNIVDELSESDRGAGGFGSTGK